MQEVIVTSVGYLKQEIAAGNHTFIADEPREAGGTNEGPDPYSLLLAALGACTAMTLQIYAKRKGWPLEKIVVRLKHSRIHAEDCTDCADRGKLERIERHISLTGALDVEQRARLLELAQRCPVHRTLSGNLLIKDFLDL